MTNRKSRTANSRFAKAGVSCFYESEVLNSSFVHLMKFSAEKPRLRKAAKRCMKPLSNKRSKKLKNNVMKLIRKKLVQDNSPPKKKDYIYIFNIINLYT